MKLLHKALGLAMTAMLFCTGQSALARTILYVPQDNRPVDFAYTVGTARDAGYTMLTPPAEYLSGSALHGSRSSFCSGSIRMLTRPMPWCFPQIP